MRAMTDTGAAARSTPLTTTNRRRTLCASLLLALMLLLPTAVAQGDTTAQDAAPTTVRPCDEVGS